MFFKNMSTEWMEEWFKPLTQNSSNVILQELALPQTIGLPAGKEGILVRAELDELSYRTFGSAVDLGYGGVVFEDSNYGSVYGTVDFGPGEKAPYSSAMNVQANDGTWGRYELKNIDFDDSLVDPAKNLNIQLLEYRFLTKGCGIVGNAYTVENVTENQ